MLYSRTDITRLSIIVWPICFAMDNQIRCKEFFELAFTVNGNNFVFKSVQ